jgi:hypothetical protein
MAWTSASSRISANPWKTWGTQGVTSRVTATWAGGACYHRLLADETLDIAFADALIRNLLRGIQPCGR